MDVICTHCGDSWDVYYLLDEAIYDTGLDLPEITYWNGLSREDQLSGRYVADFKAAGWEFGSHLLHVKHCPSCKEGGRLDPTIRDEISQLAVLFGTDTDGFAIAVSDLMEE